VDRKPIGVPEYTYKRSGVLIGAWTIYSVHRLIVVLATLIVSGAVGGVSGRLERAAIQEWLDTHVQAHPAAVPNQNQTGSLVTEDGNSPVAVCSTFNSEQ
jgi:hypothetical protein